MTRLGVLNFGLRHIARPLLARTKTPERAARDFNYAARFAFRKPRGMSFETRHLLLADRELAISRISCGKVEDNVAILYFHGGGYVAGSAWIYRGMLARLSQLAGAPVFAPDYRLAQTASFPAAFEDGCTAWEVLRRAHPKLPANRIVLGGDSAGGGLALALLAHLLDKDERPAGAFAFSPWTDLTMTGPSLSTNAQKDVLLTRSRMKELCDLVLAGADPTDPRISPLKANWQAPPPVYLQASETEILLDDARRMAERLHQAGGDVMLDLWPDCPHVWQIFDGWLPDSRDALQKTADFLRRTVNLTPPPPQSES